MTTTTDKPQPNVVKELRNIRDEISREIADMSFEEERAYLDKLLQDGRECMLNTSFAADGANTAQH